VVFRCFNPVVVLVAVVRHRGADGTDAIDIQSMICPVAIPASDLASAGAASVKAVNPGARFRCPDYYDQLDPTPF
jgi:hypothetical protein